MFCRKTISRCCLSACCDLSQNVSSGILPDFHAAESPIQFCSLTWAPWHWWHCMTDRCVWCNWSHQQTGSHQCPMREQQEPGVCFPPPAHYSSDRRCFCVCHSPLWCWWWEEAGRGRRSHRFLYTGSLRHQREWEKKKVFYSFSKIMIFTKTNVT